MQTTTVRPREKSRFHDLDALRASALLLGVFFHIAESYCPGRYSWAIVDSHADRLFDMFQNFCHNFRMQLFFVIAGFFAHLLLEKRGVKNYLINRSQRILLPLLLFWPILVTIINSLWFWGAKVGNRLTEAGYPESIHHLAPWKIGIGMWFHPETIVEHFSTIHLWFLYYLVLFYAFTLMVYALTRLFPSGFRKLSNTFDRGFAKLVNSRFSVLLFSLMIWGCMILMKNWTVDTPNESLIPALGPTLLYGVCFFLGWFLHRNYHLTDRFTRNWPVKLIVATAIISTIFWTGDILRFFDIGGMLSTESWRMIYFACYSVSMIMFIMGFMGLFRKCCSGKSATWRYIADSSYWIYILHIPVIVTLDIVVAPLDYPALLKYGIECAIALPILFFTYHFFVRSTVIGKLLNGRRYPFTMPWKNRGVPVREGIRQTV